MCNTGGNSGIAHRARTTLRPLQYLRTYDLEGRASEDTWRNTRAGGHKRQLTVVGRSLTKTKNQTRLQTLPLSGSIHRPHSRRSASSNFRHRVARRAQGRFSALPPNRARRRPARSNCDARATRAPPLSVVDVIINHLVGMATARRRPAAR